ncbi:UNVERIFIED_CONTAM: hypothetical protein Sindi_2327100 [Sesamum indicum]
MALIPERSIKDMTSPDLNQQSLCIKYSNLEVNCELKSGLIHLLPTFCGLAGDDPHKHLKEFHVVCSGMRPQGESLFEYWGRFNQLIESCPHHQIPDHLLIQYFYKGLSSMDRKLLEAASGGALFNKIPSETRSLISIMASNMQQFGVRYDDPPKRSNEVSNLEDRLNQLTSIVEKVVADKYQQVKACGICTLTGHANDMRPTLQESTTEHADSVGGFVGQQHRRYGLFSNTYNPGWRDHPNLSYDVVKALVTNTQQFQQQTQTSIQNLDSQISQLASSVDKLESQGKLPSQSIINPRQNASAIVLRNGKELQENVNKDGTKRGHAVKRKPEKEIEVQQEQAEPEEDHPKPLVTRPLFPERVTKAKKKEEEKEIF